MTSLKLTLSILAFITGVSAHATPGDTGCTGTIGGRVALDILIGYDNHGQLDPSLLEVTARGEKIFSSSSPKWSLVNVGTEENPFMNSMLSAEDGKSSVSIIFPEQDPSADTTQGYLELAIYNGLKASAVEITCEN